MINALHWFKEKGFSFDDKITVADVIELQNDAKRSILMPVSIDERLLRMTEDCEAIKKRLLNAPLSAMDYKEPPLWKSVVALEANLKDAQLKWNGKNP